MSTRPRRVTKMKTLILTVSAVSAKLCSDFGSYNGHVSMTAHGYTCQRWDSNEPHTPKYIPEDGGHHHFCRNPDGDVNGPWCYTRSEHMKWDYCHIDECHCQQACLPVEDTGFHYNGIISATREGIPCQNWNENSPHKVFMKPSQPSHNHCRNPNNDPKGPWCYTSDPGVRWDYCDIPVCEEIV